MTPAQEVHIKQKFKTLTFRGYDRQSAYRLILAECKLFSWEITKKELEVLL